jgi:hypothetical protein
MIEADRVVLLHGDPVIVDTPSNSGEGQRRVSSGDGPCPGADCRSRCDGRPSEAIVATEDTG